MGAHPRVAQALAGLVHADPGLWCLTPKAYLPLAEGLLQLSPGQRPGFFHRHHGHLANGHNQPTLRFG